jgi:ubiquinone/menaquinone biosynthesis C-methylase UbiE
MNPQNNKRTVAQGYDKIGGIYGEQATRFRTAQRAKYESVMLIGLDEGARVLDLGCGSGIPTTRRLARKFQVTGADISEKQVDRARENVPDAEFICSDMATLKFPPDTFDGVGAFYSIIHLPRDEQGAMLKSIASWLKPGGLLVATLGTGDTEVDFNQSWMGAPMFWSTFDAETNRRLVDEAGLSTVSDLEETTYMRGEESSVHGESETFLWIVARKPKSL